MIKISMPDNLIFKLIGSQKIPGSEEIRPFRYCLTINNDGGTILCNLLTYEILFLEQSEAAIFENKSYLPRNSVAEYLWKHYFLVPKEFNDKEFCDNTLTAFNLLSDSFHEKIITGYSIMTTTDCNARCFYCYEKNWEKLSMSEKTAKSAAEYIKEHSGGKPVSIRWFGGEPLYNSRAIDIISSILCDSEIKYTSTMVSNGYLFNDEMINKAKEFWNLKHIQITLDGTSEIYNKCKNYAEADSNPFERVINNINQLLKSGIYVRIRLNMDLHNAENLTELVEFISDKFGNDQFLSVSAHLLYEDISNIPNPHAESERHHLYDKFFTLEKLIESKGFFDVSAFPDQRANSQCMASDDRCVLITPDGRLGKCEHYINEHMWGNLNSKAIDKSQIQFFKIYRPYFEQCGECPIRPVCQVLNACPAFPKRCDQYDRKYYIKNIKRKIQKSYEKAMNS